MTIFGRWLWAGLAVLAMAFVLFCFNMGKIADEACSTVTAIAHDRQKIKYVREWLAQRTTDRAFVREIVKYHWFEANLPTTQRYIDIDWRYLGFRPHDAWVSFNVNDISDSDEDPARIASVSLNQSRCGVIIKLNGSGNLVGETGPPGDPTTIKPVADDVSVYCDP